MRAFSAIFMLLISVPSFAKTEPLAALFQVTNAKGKRIHIPSRGPIPEDYRIYEKAKATLDSSSDTAAIEATQRDLLLARLKQKTKALDHEFDDLFSALEIKRGTLLVKKKYWTAALEAIQKGLGGLAQFKWPYYWRTEHSKALSSICLRSKKVKDEACLAVAKRIVEVFPKGALETQALRDIPSVDLTPSSEMTNERLYQSYTEKVERDEEAFKPLLDTFLLQKFKDVPDLAKIFLRDFPRSQLRFRAEFLWAESLWRILRINEAQLHYLTVMDQVPLSYYAIVASERSGVSILDRVKKEPLQINRDEMNPNGLEKIAIQESEALWAKQKEEGLGFELDVLSRAKNYNTDLILYLIKLAHAGNQNLYAFKMVTELIQRKYDRLLNREFIDYVFPDRFTQEIAEASAQFKVDPLLVTSLTKQESGFKPSAISSSGALGLMQLMPFTALETKNDLLLSKLKDPKTNIAVGTQYLGSLLQKYDGNVIYALSAYNAGPNRVAKWRKDPHPEWTALDFVESIPYKETRDYVQAILRNRFWYQYRTAQAQPKITELKP